MNIVVIGVGGVGGYFGAQLAKAGNKVTFIARGAHLNAIQKNGLQIKSVKGNFTVEVKATNAISEVSEKVDLIILGVKSWQVEEVAKDIIPIVGVNTIVLPLQNGVDNTEKLMIHLPQNNVIGGLCKIVSKVEAPGIINHFAFEPEIIFGELNNEKSERVKIIKKIFDEAGIKNRIADSIQLDIWKKFLFIATYSGIGALTRSVIGEIRNDAVLKNIIKETALEILQIAIKKGIELTEKDVEKTLELINGLAYETTASMQRDIMDGKPSELHNFNGYIEQEGLKLGISTPINSFIFHALLPLENKARLLN